MSSVLYQTDLPNLINRGKVRDLYASEDHLLVVASDRISAFDVVMDQPVPNKGVVLTQLSRFWLETLPACRPHHLLGIVEDSNCPAGYGEHIEELRNRTMICRRAEVLPIECVVRGYIVGGGWKEYQADGSVSGIPLPPGLKLADKLQQPLFTPSTKATVGHDEPISFETACEMVGKDLAEQARERSLAIYSQARDYAAERGIILADTKLEFGVIDGELVLVDEVLTPDSSRFWPADTWEPGRNPASFDKQFLRDHLETQNWNKQPPPPEIPEGIIQQTGARYIEAYERLTGQKYRW